MTGAEVHSLLRPLPPALAGRAVRSGYRRFAAFTWPWFWRRASMFAAVIGGILLLAVIGRSLGDGVLAPRLWIAAWLWIGFTGIACAGPALATAVRHLHLSPAREAAGVVIAILLGAALSYGIDAWMSARVEQALGEPPGPASPGARPGWMVGINLIWLATIYLLLGGGLALRSYFGQRARLREWQQARERQALEQARRESDLRLGVLQAQVEPHFLFNTLASVRALVRSDPGRAELAIDALVGYLRAAIPRLRAGAEGVDATLAAQFELCTRYLQVMQVRMGDRLTVRIELPQALGPHPFPPLLLISLVENAIKHGIEPRPGPGCVRLAAARIGSGEEARLEVIVEDDGAGLSPTPGRGVGLSNIRGQLAARWGEAARLEVEGLASGGVRACIRVPLERAPT